METLTVRANELEEYKDAIRDGSCKKVILALRKEVGGITALEITEPTAGQLETISGPGEPLANVRAALADQNGLAAPVLKAMSGRDMMAASEIFSLFLGVSR